MQKNDENFADLDLSVCPSFSVYFSDWQGAAARAVDEVFYTSMRAKSELGEDEFGFSARRFEKMEYADEDGDEFEFEVVCGEIERMFPIFDCDVVIGGTEKMENRGEVEAANVSLGKMFINEEGNFDLSSPSEAEEFDGVVPGTYCVWKPTRTPELTHGRCKKSKSTGSFSKRWKLFDFLLRRSNSDSKESFLFLTPSSSSSSSNSSTEEMKSVPAKPKPATAVSAHELFYVKIRAVKQDDKRKSYLPYRKGLLGFGFLPNRPSFY